MDLSISRLIRRIPPDILRALTLRFDRSPFDSVDKLVEFIHTRSAYVAQTSLYGYLKTRMGTQYRVMFEDEVFSQSINFAKWRVYASCLSDLTVFSAATVMEHSEMTTAETAELAKHCFTRAVEATFDDANDPELVSKIISDFAKRVKTVDWAASAEGENAFRQSPVDLLKWAPVIDEFKELDEEIVVNSTRFRWRDVRDQLRKRADAPAIYNDWRQAEVRS